MPSIGVPATNLTQWNGSFKDLTGVNRTFTMVGTDPHKSNVTSTVPLIVVPIKIVFSVSSTVDQSAGTFSQDTAALSHEIGEWMDDPFIDNNVGCQDNSILEVGDPLVLDDHAYKVGSFTFHLQDLVWIGYFGAPPKTSLLSWLSFQNDKKNICPGQ